MAHKHLKGRKKAKSVVKQTLKASAKAAKCRKVPKPEFKNKKARRAAAAAAATAAIAAATAVAAVTQKATGLPREGVAEGAGAPTRARRLKKEDRQQAALEKQHLSLYSAGERIMLVGEGNFSFALALCRHLGSGTGVFASAYDSEAVLRRKYPDSVENRRQLEDDFGAITLVGVDATRMHKVQEFRHSFSKVVWNFPHIGGGEADVEKSMADHRKLLVDFFASAARCLDPQRPSAVHVALKIGEPYKSWKVVQLARTAQLELLTTVPFVTTAWPGYAHRRTAGFDERLSKADSEELAKGAKVYVFARRQEPVEE